MRAEKKSAFEEIRKKVSGSGFVILTDYKGLNVSKTQELKKRLRGVNASMQVVKNRVFSHVAKDLGVSGLEAHLSGPSAMVFGQGDVVTVAKVLKDFIKENEKPKIKAGTLKGAAISADEVAQLAALPSREILLSKLVGTLAAPMQGIVGVLQQKVASVVYVLKAIEQKKQQANG